MAVTALLEYLDNAVYLSEIKFASNSLVVSKHVLLRRCQYREVMPSLEEDHVIDDKGKAKHGKQTLVGT